VAAGVNSLRRMSRTSNVSVLVARIWIRPRSGRGCYYGGHILDLNKLTVLQRTLEGVISTLLYLFATVELVQLALAIFARLKKSKNS